MTTKQEYRVIEVRGYYRKHMVGGVETKKWIAPHKRKIKSKPIDTSQKTVEEFNTKWKIKE